MPSLTRKSVSRKRSAATRIQKQVRGKQTRKKVAILIRDQRNLEISNQCAICLDKFAENEAQTILECGHRFHSRCIQRSLRAGITSCPMCRSIITDYDYLQLANPNITLQQAIHNRREALEERRLAIEAYNDATWRTRNYEQSNRSRRLRGIISPTYTTLLTREDSAANEVTRTRAHVTNSNNVLRRLSNLRVRN